MNLEDLIELIKRRHVGDTNLEKLKLLVEAPENEEKEEKVTKCLEKLLKKDRDNEYILEYLGIERVENPDMIFVKGGKYKPSFSDLEVIVADLEVCKYQTYQDMWTSVMGNNPSNRKSGRLPVENVSWWDALHFCNKLSEKEGYEPVYQITNGKLKINQLSGNAVEPNVADFRDTEGYRLPTEVEWEWFAQGGRNRTNTTYAGSDNIDEVAWFYSNSGRSTREVGTKKPNEIGFYDCSGNVWEWCYDTNNNGHISEERPYIYEQVQSNRRMKGGCYDFYSWGNVAYGCGLSDRNDGAATNRNNSYGFRVCRTK